MGRLRMLETAGNERGYTLIELLTVLLVIGVLAAIAIPTFLNQQGKAYGAGAKELAHSAQLAAEAFATDNRGSYTNLSPAVLAQYDRAIAITAGSGSAYVAGVSNAGVGGYTITIAPSSGSERFSVTRNARGLSRTCTPATGVNGGCANGSW